MKLKTVVLGLGVAIFTGCGGSGSSSLEATGRIALEDANELQRAVLLTGLDPEEMLLNALEEENVAFVRNKESALTFVNEHNVVTDDSWVWEGLHECGVEGNYTNKVISGINPYDQIEDVNASIFVYETNYDHCDQGWGIKKTGTRKGTWDWTYDGHTRTNTWSSTTENFVYEINATHKYTTTSYSASGTYTFTEDDTGQNENYSKHYVRSGTLIDGDSTIEFKNITRDKSKKSSYIFETEKYTYESKWEISGGIKSDDLGGWVIIDTLTAKELDSNDTVTVGDISTDCAHAGKITISGIEHTVSVEAHADHSIDIKYDDTLLKEYANCIEYYNDH